MENGKLALAVAVAALVPSIYGAALPPLATVRGQQDDAHTASAERTAMFTSAAVVAAASAVSGSGEVLVLAGGMAAAYALLYRAARKTTA